MNNRQINTINGQFNGQLMDNSMDNRQINTINGNNNRQLMDG